MAEDAGTLLSADELSTITQALEALKAIRQGDDAEKIKASIENVEQACAFYVERRMNQNIEKAMSGHKVEDFEK